MTTRSLRLSLSAALLALSVAVPQRGSADLSVGAVTSFGQGRVQLQISGGTGTAFSQTYFVLGLGANYYIIDGLGLGLSFESWVANSPTIYKLSPSVQYVFTQIPSLNPYVGVFYTRTFVDTYSDLNSVGARGGVYLPLGRNAYLGIGGVYESYLDCNESSWNSCSDFYPELRFAIGF